MGANSADVSIKFDIDVGQGKKRLAELAADASKAETSFEKMTQAIAKVGKSNTGLSNVNRALLGMATNANKAQEQLESIDRVLSSNGDKYFVSRQKQLDMLKQSLIEYNQALSAGNQKAAKAAQEQMAIYYNAYNAGGKRISLSNRDFIYGKDYTVYDDNGVAHTSHIGGLAIKGNDQKKNAKIIIDLAQQMNREKAEQTRAMRQIDPTVKDWVYSPQSMHEFVKDLRNAIKNRMDIAAIFGEQSDFVNQVFQKDLENTFEGYSQKSGQYFKDAQKKYGVRSKMPEFQYHGQNITRSKKDDALARRMQLTNNPFALRANSMEEAEALARQNYLQSQGLSDLKKSEQQARKELQDYIKEYQEKSDLYDELDPEEDEKQVKKLQKWFQNQRQNRLRAVENIQKLKALVKVNSGKGLEGEDLDLYDYVKDYIINDFVGFGWTDSQDKERIAFQEEIQKTATAARDEWSLKTDFLKRNKKVPGQKQAGLAYLKLQKDVQKQRQTEYEVPDDIVTQKSVQKVSAIEQAWVKTRQQVQGTAEASQKIMYHWGNLVDASDSKKTHQLGGQVTAFIYGKKNGTSFADGTGAYTTTDVSQYSKPGANLSTSDPLRRINKLDVSKLNLFEQNIQQRADDFFNFQHSLERYVMSKANPDFHMFDEELKHLSSDPNKSPQHQLFEQAKKVMSNYSTIFDAAFSNVEEFTSWISQMVGLVQATGMDKNGRPNPKMLAAVNQKYGVDDVKTRFMKQLGFEGTNLTGTSYNSLKHGNVIYDINNPKITRRSFESLDDAQQDAGIETERMRKAKEQEEQERKRLEQEERRVQEQRKRLQNEKKTAEKKQENERKSQQKKSTQPKAEEKQDTTAPSSAKNKEAEKEAEAVGNSAEEAGDKIDEMNNKLKVTEKEALSIIEKIGGNVKSTQRNTEDNAVEQFLKNGKYAVSDQNKDNVKYNSWKNTVRSIGQAQQKGVTKDYIQSLIDSGTLSPKMLESAKAALQGYVEIEKQGTIAAQAYSDAEKDLNKNIAAKKLEKMPDKKVAGKQKPQKKQQQKEEKKQVREQQADEVDLDEPILQGYIEPKNKGKRLNFKGTQRERALRIIQNKIQAADWTLQQLNAWANEVNSLLDSQPYATVGKFEAIADSKQAEVKDRFQSKQALLDYWRKQKVDNAPKRNAKPQDIFNKDAKDFGIIRQLMLQGVKSEDIFTAKSGPLSKAQAYWKYIKDTYGDIVEVMNQVSQLRSKYDGSKDTGQIAEAIKQRGNMEAAKKEHEKDLKEYKKKKAQKKAKTKTKSSTSTSAEGTTTRNETITQGRDDGELSPGFHTDSSQFQQQFSAIISAIAEQIKTAIPAASKVAVEAIQQQFTDLANSIQASISQITSSLDKLMGAGTAEGATSAITTLTSQLSGLLSVMQQIKESGKISIQFEPKNLKDSIDNLNATDNAIKNGDLSNLKMGSHAATIYNLKNRASLEEDIDYQQKPYTRAIQKLDEYDRDRLSEILETIQYQINDDNEFGGYLDPGNPQLYQNYANWLTNFINEHSISQLDGIQQLTFYGEKGDQIVNKRLPLVREQVANGYVPMDNDLVVGKTYQELFSNLRDIVHSRFLSTENKQVARSIIEGLFATDFDLAKKDFSSLLQSRQDIFGKNRGFFENAINQSQQLIAEQIDIRKQTEAGAKYNTFISKDEESTGNKQQRIQTSQQKNLPSISQEVINSVNEICTAFQNMSSTVVGQIFGVGDAASSVISEIRQSLTTVGLLSQDKLSYAMSNWAQSDNAIFEKRGLNDPDGHKGAYQRAAFINTRTRQISNPFYYDQLDSIRLNADPQIAKDIDQNTRKFKTYNGHVHSHPRRIVEDPFNEYFKIDGSFVDRNTGEVFDSVPTYTTIGEDLIPSFADTQTWVNLWLNGITHDYIQSNGKLLHLDFSKLKSHQPMLQALNEYNKSVSSFQESSGGMWQYIRDNGGIDTKNKTMDFSILSKKYNDLLRQALVKVFDEKYGGQFGLASDIMSIEDVPQLGNNISVLQQFGTAVASLTTNIEKLIDVLNELKSSSDVQIRINDKSVDETISSLLNSKNELSKALSDTNNELSKALHEWDQVDDIQAKYRGNKKNVPQEYHDKVIRKGTDERFAFVNTKTGQISHTSMYDQPGLTTPDIINGLSKTVDLSKYNATVHTHPKYGTMTAELFDLRKHKASLQDVLRPQRYNFSAGDVTELANRMLKDKAGYNPDLSKTLVESGGILNQLDFQPIMKFPKVIRKIAERYQALEKSMGFDEVDKLVGAWDNGKYDYGKVAQFWDSSLKQIISEQITAHNQKAAKSKHFNTPITATVDDILRHGTIDEIVGTSVITQEEAVISLSGSLKQLVSILKQAKSNGTVDIKVNGQGIEQTTDKLSRMNQEESSVGRSAGLFAPTRGSRLRSRLKTGSSAQNEKQSKQQRKNTIEGYLQKLDDEYFNGLVSPQDNNSDTVKNLKKRISQKINEFIKKYGEEALDELNIGDGKNYKSDATLKALKDVVDSRKKKSNPIQQQAKEQPTTGTDSQKQTSKKKKTKTRLDVSQYTKAARVVETYEPRRAALQAKQDSGLLSSSELKELQRLNQQLDLAAEKIQEYNKARGESAKYTKAESDAQQKISNAIEKGKAQYEKQMKKNQELSKTLNDDTLINQTNEQFQKIKSRNIQGLDLSSYQRKIKDLNLEKVSGTISELDYIKKTQAQLNKIRRVESVVAPGTDTSTARRMMIQSIINQAAMKGKVISERDISWSEKTSKSGASTGTAKVTIANSAGQDEVIMRQYDSTLGYITKADTTLKKHQTTFQKFASMYKSKLLELGTYLGSFVSFYQVWGALKQGVNTVKQFDTALTEMRKVSSESTSTLQSFQKESFGIADSVGTTALQIQQSTADFMRLGQSLDQAKESAANASLLLNVSEFDSIDDATTSLIAMTQAFDDYSQMEILDALNKVGNQFSISTEGLSVALQKSASALRTEGNDLAESIALLTAGNQVVQDPQSVGAAMKVISLRLAGQKQELKEQGEDVEDMVETTSKLQEGIMNATRVASNNFQGIDIEDQNGNLRSTYDIILDIAKIWKQIGQNDLAKGTNEQAYLLETMAGKMRSNVLASILQSPDILQSSYQAAQNSKGSAEIENQKYLESIQGKQQVFQNKLQELTTTLLDSSIVKWVVDSGSAILGFIDNLISSIGSLGTVIAGLFAGKGIASFVKNFDMLAAIGTKAGTDKDILKQLLLGKADGSEIGEIFSSLISKGLINATDQQNLQRVEPLFEKIFGKDQTAELFTPLKENFEDFKQALASDGGIIQSVKGKLLNLKNALVGVAQSAIRHPLISLGALGVTALITAITLYKRHKEAMIQTANSATSVWNNSKNSLQQYIDQYTQLKLQLDSGDLSEQEQIGVKQQLLDLQKQIVQQYGAQASGIDLVNGKLSEQLTQLNSISQNEAITNISDNLSAYEDAMGEMQKQRNYTVFSFSDEIKDTQIKKQLDGILQKYQGFVTEPLAEGFSSINFVGNAAQAHDALTSLIADLNGIKNVSSGQAPILQNIIKQANKAIEATKGTLDDYQANYNSYLEQTLYSKGGGSKLAGFASSISNFNDALLGSDEEAIDNAREKYKQSFQQILSFIGNLGHNGQLSPQLKQGLNDYILSVNENLNKSQAQLHDFQEALSTTLSGEQFDESNIYAKRFDDSLQKITKDIKKMDLDEVDIQQMWDIKGTNEQQQAVRSLAEAFDITKDMWGSGTAQGEAKLRAFINALIQAGVITGQVATQAAAAQEQLASVWHDPNLYDVQDATKQTELGDNYDAYVKNLKRGKELRESNDVGTKQFKSIAKSFSPSGSTGWQNFDQNIEDADRWFSGDQTQDITNFLADMQEAGYAIQDEAGDWSIGIMDLGEAAVKATRPVGQIVAMLGLLNDKGYSVTAYGSGTQALQGLADKKLELDAAEQKLEHMKQLQKEGSGDYTLAIQEQEQQIEKLRDQYNTTADMIPQLAKKQAEGAKEQAQIAQKYIDQMYKGYKSIEDDTSIDDQTKYSILHNLRDQIETFAKQNGLVLDITGDTLTVDENSSYIQKTKQAISAHMNDNQKRVDEIAEQLANAEYGATKDGGESILSKLGFNLQGIDTSNTQAVSQAIKGQMDEVAQTFRELGLTSDVQNLSSDITSNATGNAADIISAIYQVSKFKDPEQKKKEQQDKFREGVLTKAKEAADKKREQTKKEKQEEFREGVLTKAKEAADKKRHEQKEDDGQSEEKVQEQQEHDKPQPQIEAQTEAQVQTAQPTQAEKYSNEGRPQQTLPTDEVVVQPDTAVIQTDNSHKEQVQNKRLSDKDSTMGSDISDKEEPQTKEQFRNNVLVDKDENEQPQKGLIAEFVDNVITGINKIREEAGQETTPQGQAQSPESEPTKDESQYSNEGLPGETILQGEPLPVENATIESENIVVQSPSQEASDTIDLSNQDIFNSANNQNQSLFGSSDNGSQWLPHAQQNEPESKPDATPEDWFNLDGSTIQSDSVTIETSQIQIPQPKGTVEIEESDKVGSADSRQYPTFGDTDYNRLYGGGAAHTVNTEQQVTSRATITDIDAPDDVSVPVTGQMKEVQDEVSQTPEVQVQGVMNQIKTDTSTATATVPEDRSAAPKPAQQQNTTQSTSQNKVQVDYSEVEKAKSKVDELNATTITDKKFTVIAQNLTSTLNNTNRLSQIQIGDKAFSVTANGIGNALLALHQVISALNSIPSEKTVTVRVSQQGSVGGATALGTAHALGTFHSPLSSITSAYAQGRDFTVGSNETALVNEIGQESIVRDGKWMLLPGGPHLEQLRSSDIVFNAKQTDDLLKTGKTARSGKLIPAHSDGTFDDTIDFYDPFEEMIYDPELLADSFAYGTFDPFEEMIYGPEVLSDSFAFAPDTDGVAHASSKYAPPLSGTNKTNSSNNSSSNNSSANTANTKATKENTKAQKENTDETKENTDKKKKEGQVFDWITSRLSVLAEKTEHFANAINEFTSYSDKMANLVGGIDKDGNLVNGTTSSGESVQGQISSVMEEISAHQQASARYTQEAQSVKNPYSEKEIKNAKNKKEKKQMQKANSQFEEFKQMIDGGYAIDISKIKDEKLAEQLQNYQQYADAARQARQSIEELRKKLIELYKEMANAPIEEAGKQIDRMKKGVNGLEAAEARLQAVQKGGSTQALMNNLLGSGARGDYRLLGGAGYRAVRADNRNKTRFYVSSYQIAIRELREAYNNLFNHANFTNNMAQQQEQKKKQAEQPKKYITKPQLQRAGRKLTKKYKRQLTKKQRTRLKRGQRINTDNINGKGKKGKAAVAAAQSYNKMVTQYENQYDITKKEVKSSGRDVARKYGKKLNPKQIKALRQGRKASVKGLTGKAKKAVQQQNKLVNEYENQYPGVKYGKKLARNYSKQLTAEQKRQLRNGEKVTLKGTKGKLRRKLKKYNTQVKTGGVSVPVAEEGPGSIDIPTGDEIVADAQAALQAFIDSANIAETDFVTSAASLAEQKVQEIRDNFDYINNAYETQLGFQEELRKLNEQVVDDAETFGNSINSAMRDRQIANLKIERHLKQTEVSSLKKQLEVGMTTNGSDVNGSTPQERAKASLKEPWVAMQDVVDKPTTKGNINSPVNDVSETQGVILEGSREWVEMTQTIKEAEQAVHEYDVAIKKLELKKFDDINDHYETQIGFLETIHQYYERNIDDTEKFGDQVFEQMRDFEKHNLQIEKQRKQIQADSLQRQLNEAVSGGYVEQYSLEWVRLKKDIYEAQQAVHDYNVQQKELDIKKLEDIVNHYNKIVDFMQTMAGLNNIWYDRDEAISNYKKESYYTTNISDQRAIANKQIQEAVKEQEMFNKLVSQGVYVKNSDSYIAKQAEINKLWKNGYDTLNEVAKLEAEWIQYSVDNFNRVIDKQDTFINNLNIMAELINDAQMWDYDSGDLQTPGQLNMVVDKQSFDQALSEIQQIDREKNRLYQEFRTNANYGQEAFDENIKALTEQQMDALQAAKSALESFTETVEVTAQRQLAALNKVIDKHKEALAKKKA